MCNASIKDKKLEEMVLPQDLVAWFGLVYKGILRKDESTQIESNDCIQYGEDNFAFGGLIDKKRKLFMFTYFPVGSLQNKGKWTFELTEDQIRNIAQGKLKSLRLWACQQDGCQMKSDKQSHICFYHDYIDDGKPSPSKLTNEDLETLQKQKQALLKKWIEEHDKKTLNAIGEIYHNLGS